MGEGPRQEGGSGTRGRLVLGAWLVLVGVVAIGIAVLVGRDAHRTAAAQTARMVPKKPLARYNTVVSATGATITRGRDGTTRLRLTGVRPMVELFDVSPGTERALMPTWVWTESWRQLYRRYEPNTTITWRQGGKRQALTVALASGKVRSDGSLVFVLRRRAAGTKRALPLAAPVYPARSAALRDVSVFVDPVVPPGGDPVTIVNEALQTLGELETSTQVWDWTPSNRGILEPLPNGEAWAGMSVPIGSGGLDGTAITMDYNPAVAAANLPDAMLNLISTQPGDGGYLMNLSMPGGQLRFGPQGQNNVLFDTDLTGGTLVFAAGSAPTQGNMLINTDLTNATVSVSQAPGNIIVTPTLEGTTWSGGPSAALGLSGTTFLGADFSASTFDGIDFSGATIAPMVVQSETGATSTIVSSFSGMQLGTNVTFGTAPAITLLQSVDFSGTRIAGTSFANATITGCTFAGATIDAAANASASFAGATIANTTFASATVTSADFSGSTLSAADFSLAGFGSTAGAVSFRNASIQPGTVFTSGSGIENADFTGAKMGGVVFATGGGAGSPASFVATLLNAIGTTYGDGVIINNTQYAKDETGQVYQVSTDGSTWQPVTVGGGPGYAIAPAGDPIPAPQPDPVPEGVQEFGT